MMFDLRRNAIFALTFLLLKEIKGWTVTFLM